MTNKEKILGAQGATEGVSAGSSAPEAASHAVVKLKPTPGPWSQSHRECHDGMWNTQVYDKNGEAIATLHWYPFKDGRVTHTLREANARLIAAAPDFYREAVRVVEWLERLAASADERAKDRRFPSLSDALTADAKNYRASAKGLKAAIAKAEGKQIGSGNQPANAERLDATRRSEAPK